MATVIVCSSTATNVVTAQPRWPLVVRREIRGLGHLLQLIHTSSNVTSHLRAAIAGLCRTWYTIVDQNFGDKIAASVAQLPFVMASMYVSFCFVLLFYGNNGHRKRYCEG